MEELDLCTEEEYLNVLSSQSKEYLEDAINELSGLVHVHDGELIYGDALKMHEEALRIKNEETINSSI